MSTEQVGAQSESLLALAQDYQEVFATPAGRRVLDHLLNAILKNGRLSVNLDGTPPTGEQAIYMIAGHDAARRIMNLLSHDFRTRQQPPVVHHHRRQAPRRPTTHETYQDENEG